MNKHIELVKKWLAEPESVTLEELKANKEAAWAVYADAVYADAEDAYDAYEAAYVAAAAAYCGYDAHWAAYVASTAYGDTYADATYWRNKVIEHIEKYEELTK